MSKSTQTRPKYQFQLKRRYDRPDTTGGVRVLADRMWPRGFEKGSRSLNMKHTTRDE